MDSFSKLDVFFELGKPYEDLDIIKDFAENCGNLGQVLKGGLALAYLYGDSSPSARATVDIDYHISEEKIWNEFKTKSATLATENSKLGLIYTRDIESKKNKIHANGETIIINWRTKDNKSRGYFKIDMNYGSYCKISNTLDLAIYSPEMIIADKTCVLFSPGIRRRVKDIYDLFLVVSNEDFIMSDLVLEVKNKLSSRKQSLGKLSLLDFNLLYDIQKGYNSLILEEKPDFELVCKTIMKFVIPLADFVGGLKDVDALTDKYSWSSEKLSWYANLNTGFRLKTDIVGTIYRESASHYLNASSFPPFPILLQNDKIDLDMYSVKFTTENYNEDRRTEIRKGLYITAFDRTVLDLMNGEFKIFSETLESFLQEWGLEKGYNHLLVLSEKYKVKEKFLTMYKETLEYLNRDY